MTSTGAVTDGEEIEVLDCHMRSLIEKRKYEDAETFLKNYIATLETKRTTNPAILANAYNWLGLCHYKSVKFDHAKALYSKALQFNRNCAAALYNRGTVEYRMGDASAAVEDMTAAVALAPDNEEFLQGLTSARQLADQRMESYIPC